MNSKEEFESKYIIVHVMTHNLFKDDKSLLFNTKEEAKDYLKKHLMPDLHYYRYICTIKEHNDLCLRWWGNGQLAHFKMIDIEEYMQLICKKHDKVTQELEAQAKIIQTGNYGVIPPKPEINIQEV